MCSSFDVYHVLGRACFWCLLLFSVEIRLLNTLNPTALQTGDKDKEIKNHFTSQRWKHRSSGKFSGADFTDYSERFNA